MSPTLSGSSLPLALDAVVLDCPDVVALSVFYLRVLGWRIRQDSRPDWIDIASPAGGVKLAFQRSETYIRPVWPGQTDCQQQMTHLDFAVRDEAELERAVAHALDCGATLPESQFGGALWRTLLDPVGHPFCFVIWQ